jgi:hypothetical protein
MTYEQKLRQNTIAQIAAHARGLLRLDARHLKDIGLRDEGEAVAGLAALGDVELLQILVREPLRPKRDVRSDLRGLAEREVEG